jgi:hypothetical protein
MAKFAKGQSGNPAGRPAGSKGKTQAEIKEAFQLLVEGNLPNIESWLKSTALKDPAKALELVIKLSEFVLPKMKATEISGTVEAYPPPRTLTKEEAREFLAEWEKNY